MGEAKQKLRAHAAMLVNAGCIYCVGENAATTIEHMPPISIFEGRQRPKGLEFPSCQACNNNTGHADLVAAMLARLSKSDSVRARCSRMLATTTPMFLLISDRPEQASKPLLARIKELIDYVFLNPTIPAQ